eukprot:CAMPEP_0181219946 /NCGR_PEP_ID=MMETSP1096-20121128/28568_1 /TAXON_ID=156174 ORGANISM="Chrysochromulina ericina, Strain CCMP281" /NCGR_SAMPLE_ID=MMETSP1096 /ASSEMBLY_ACC=CAM_ASM_000453 /LENGTH=159 /DNA_ID=CAMNT_0023312403 /DNA_START=359 /DNA_END=838 /DNA_ORIENTATION=+
MREECQDPLSDQSDQLLQSGTSWTVSLLGSGGGGGARWKKGSFAKAERSTLRLEFDETAVDLDPLVFKREVAVATNVKSKAFCERNIPANLRCSDEGSEPPMGLRESVSCTVLRGETIICLSVTVEASLRPVSASHAVSLQCSSTSARKKLVLRTCSTS